MNLFSVVLYPTRPNRSNGPRCHFFEQTETRESSHSLSTSLFKILFVLRTNIYIVSRKNDGCWLQIHDGISIFLVKRNTSMIKIQYVSKHSCTNNVRKWRKFVF